MAGETDEKLTSGEHANGAAIPGGPVLRSHEVAELAGTTPRALRHYHKIGLLPEVPRDMNGYRRYSPHDLVRVLRIRQLAVSGMPLRKIRDLLEQGPQSQDDLLAEFEKELETQARRIEAQRTMIAELRRLQLPTSLFSDADRPTATQQLDRDIWTTVTTIGGMDGNDAAAVLDVLQGTPLAEEASAWYAEFEGLAVQSRIDAAAAAQLAGRIADFADAVTEAAGLAPAEENAAIMTLIEQMQAEVLSPAQQDVWNRFFALIEQRWKSTGTPPQRSGGHSSG